MLDSGRKKVCKALLELCGADGTYKVIESTEIMDRMPDVYMTKVELSTIIRDLKDRDYIHVKYFTPDEYCIEVLPIVEKEFKKEKAQSIPPIVALEQGRDLEQKDEENLGSGNKEEEKIEVETQVAARSTSSTNKKLLSKIFAAAICGSFLGGAIVAALAIILQKFVF